VLVTLVLVIVMVRVGIGLAPRLTARPAEPVAFEPVAVAEARETPLPFSRARGRADAVADSVLRENVTPGDSVERFELADIRVAFVRRAAGDADLQLVYPAPDGGGSVVVRLNSTRVARLAGRAAEPRKLPGQKDETGAGVIHAGPDDASADAISTRSGS